MQYVYLLQSQKDNGYYIGCTAKIIIRLSQHNSGQVPSTKLRAPWKLIYFEAYESVGAAFEREKKLKDFGSAYTGLLKRLKLK